jgi:Na+/alanine symporter
MAYYYIAETNVAYLTQAKGSPPLMLLLKIGILAATFLVVYVQQKLLGILVIWA